MTDNPLVGRRVRLVRCTDEYSTIAPGTLGSVRLVDSMGTVHVTWDDGRQLGLIPGVDRWELLPAEPEWPTPTVPRPTLIELGADVDESGACDATDGCRVEPDAVCPHGHPSWVLHLGLV